MCNEPSSYSTQLAPLVSLYQASVHSEVSPQPNLSFKTYFSGATAKDQNAIKPFTLVLVVSRHPDSLPIAHTCFNRIDIPLYPSREVFSAKLTQAIDETMGFHVD